MDYVAYFLIAKVAIFQGFVYSDVINLSLPKYAIDGEDIWVKCSSDIVPYEQIAEFLVNGVTTDIIRRHNNDCFSSITRTVCSTDVCNCSSDGKSYSTNLFTNNQIGNVSIACSMKFKRNEEVFKTEHLYISLLGKCKWTACSNEILKDALCNPSCQHDSNAFLTNNYQCQSNINSAATDSGNIVIKAGQMSFEIKIFST